MPAVIRLSLRFSVQAFVFCVILSSTELFAANAPVTVTDLPNSYALDNGILSARVAKRSGDLISLRYRGLEMLAGNTGRDVAYWSHDTARGERADRLTINPKTNGGTLAEISIKGISQGRPMGAGPGGSVIADIEIRYALRQGDSGLYTYSIFSHPTNYPATGVGEGRFCAKLNDDIFDWMTVDADRNMKLISAYDWNHGTPLNLKEVRRMNSGIFQGGVEHKYDYSANQFATPAWGWSSTAKNIGIWFVNPTIEYLSGGPTKFELSAHRDATFDTNDFEAPAPPCLLNYWRSSHYGGSSCVISNGETWNKVIGPFLIYCNAGKSPATMWHDALQRSTKESNAWPYDWVAGVDYPHKNERGTVNGEIILTDPQARLTKFSKLLVGLSAPEYIPPRMSFGRVDNPTNDAGEVFNFSSGAEDESAATNWNHAPAPDQPDAFERDFRDGRGTNNFGGANRFASRRFGRGPGGFGGFGAPQPVDWQNDAKHYQFWVQADAQGNFSIPNVRPGNYTLHAIADGVLGEFVLTNVTVEPGMLQLGKLKWQPARYGKQLWDIGIANRSGGEFFKGNDYAHWGWYLEYPKLFPHDVNYLIGASNFREDWFFEQVPRNENSANTTGAGEGRATTWTITFYLSGKPHGKATLRLAICGAAARTITVGVNGNEAGTILAPFYNATIDRDGIAGLWSERDLAFDASLMQAGKNVLTLTIPAGRLTNGIIYDYVRLELDESAAPPSTAEKNVQRGT